jgi:hypothetical protein
LIDGNRQEFFIHLGEDPMLVWNPFGESGQILRDLVGIGVEDMRTVTVNQHTLPVRLVEGVPGNMLAAIDDQNGISCIGQTLSRNASAKSGANN